VGATGIEEEETKKKNGERSERVKCMRTIKETKKKNGERSERVKCMRTIKERKKKMKDEEDMK
jgi:hypothetical protein